LVVNKVVEFTQTVGVPEIVPALGAGFTVKVKKATGDPEAQLPDGAV
jgi:hypothetical protein